MSEPAQFDDDVLISHSSHDKQWVHGVLKDLDPFDQPTAIRPNL